YGELTHDLLKPVPVFQQFLSRELADRSFAFFVEVIPVFIISMIAFRVRIYSIMNLGLFLAGLLMSFMINFLLGYLAGMLAFWIKNIESIQWLMFFIVRFMSGEFVPLDFMGSTMMAASRFLPFYYLRYGLIQVFIGRVSFAESVFFLAGQLAWVLLLYLCVRLVWGIALKKFGAEGG
ncbi:ABC-2 family transporter protein, partial [Candidatus Woesearchaeota archaeon]|nr:ABC-2 family transporter protein [Candidatus Woesearchaeota archaeon]